MMGEIQEFKKMRGDRILTIKIVKSRTSTIAIPILITMFTDSAMAGGSTEKAVTEYQHSKSTLFHTNIK